MLPTRIIELTERPYAGIHTVSRMQPRQLAGIGERTLREQLLTRLPVEFDRWYETQIPDDVSVRLDPIRENNAAVRSALSEESRRQLRSRAREAIEGSPTFLNRSLDIVDSEGVSWFDERFDELPLLWPLKLYAFQPLSWTTIGFDAPTGAVQSTFDDWIQDWIDTTEIGRPGYLRSTWTPWAVSLRIIHWSRYLAWRDTADTVSGGEFEATVHRALYKNARFLQNHVEWDVGGNHLIENGAALVIAGLLFDEESWITSGERILNHTARTQFLDDGCHFERSPMYHVLTVTRYLTVCDLLDRFDRPVPQQLRTVTEKATAFLSYLRPPDGRIPLLNDAVYGQAFDLDDCLRYGRELGFDGECHSSDGHASGYHWLRTDVGAVLVDGGPVGPPHLPGHSHSDTLSILLWIGDQPVATDTGTFGYTSTSRREYARGVRGHNTVQVDESEPIALGGKYLMGPRPEPEMRLVDGTVSLFEGRYEASPYGRELYVHHRSIFAGDTWWVVQDTVDGHGCAPVRSRLHLHPDGTPVVQSNDRAKITLGAEESVVVSPLDSTQLTLSESEYFPRFGVAVDRPLLEFDAKTTNSPTSFGYVITRDGTETELIEQYSSDGTRQRLDVDGTEHRLPERDLLPGE